MKKDYRLEDVEHYSTPASFMCKLCCNIVFKGQTAALEMYSYIDPDPIIDFGEGERTFDFVRVCKSCGGDACTVIHNN